MSDLWRKAKNKASYQKQEESLARAGGSKQINSGRLWHSKRDVKLDGYLIEARSVGKNNSGEPIKSYSIKADELKKLEKDAFFHNALPAMQIDFEKTNGRYIVTRLQDWESEHQERTALEQQVIELQKEINSLLALIEVNGAYP